MNKEPFLERRKTKIELRQNKYITLDEVKKYEFSRFFYTTHHANKVREKRGIFKTGLHFDSFEFFLFGLSSCEPIAVDF